MAQRWRIESVCCVETTAPPTAEEMDALVPASWPAGWEELDRHVGPGSLRIQLGHASPDARYAAERGANHRALIDPPPGFKASDYDFTADLQIGYVDDSQIDILDLNEVKAGAPTELEEARKLLEEMGDELPADELADLEELLGEATEFIPAVQELTYLGETARGAPNDDGDVWIMSVLIGRFSLYGPLIGSDEWPEPGNTPIHSVKCHNTRMAHDGRGCNCQACDCGPPGCSTIAREGFVHREAVQQLLRGVFASVKGEAPEKKTAVGIIREGDTVETERIEDPDEGFEIRDGDTIETKRAEVTVRDPFDTLIALTENTRVKFHDPRTLEQFQGELKAQVRRMEEAGRSLEILTPQAVLADRGTAFGLRVEPGVTTLTVAEGRVELSDRAGNTVTVQAGQCCTCSEHGLSTPAPAPVT